MQVLYSIITTAGYKISYFNEDVFSIQVSLDLAPGRSQKQNVLTVLLHWGETCRSLNSI